MNIPIANIYIWKTIRTMKGTIGKTALRYMRKDCVKMKMTLMMTLMMRIHDLSVYQTIKYYYNQFFE